MRSRRVGYHVRCQIIWPRMDATSKNLVPYTPRTDAHHDRLTEIVGSVLDSVHSKHSKRSYKKSLEKFLAWYTAEAAGQAFNKATVQRYAQRLAEQGTSTATQNV